MVDEQVTVFSLGPFIYFNIILVELNLKISLSCKSRNNSKQRKVTKMVGGELKQLQTSYMVCELNILWDFFSVFFYIYFCTS